MGLKLLLKNIILFTICILISSQQLKAQTPNQFKYQAILRTNTGVLMENEEVEVNISILDSSPTGSSIFEEVHNVYTNDHGLINLNIGSIENLDVLNWSANSYFIKIKVNGSFMGTTQLLAVPYAFKSNYAEITKYDNIINKPDFEGWDNNESDDFSGDYKDLNNKPVFKTDISDFSDTTGLIFSKKYEDLDNTPNFEGWDTNNSDDFSGDYDELTNKPNISKDISGLTDTLSLLFNKDYNDLLNKPDISSWDIDTLDDFSGDYNDLVNKPLNLSEFNNDIGFITDSIDSSSTNELQNLTEVLTISNDAGNQNIINLSDPVEDQDAATKAYVDLLLEKINDLEVLAYGIVDYDGNTYKVTKIGNQWWMAENLKTTHYSDGTNITLITDNIEWKDRQEEAFCYYNNEMNEYGALYNWYAAMNGTESSTVNPSGVQGVCPTGWHLPSYAEWQELRDFLSLDGNAEKEAYALKTKSGWYADGNGSNRYHFSAVPGGYRFGEDGEFLQNTKYGFWWTSNEFDSDSALFQFMGYQQNIISLNKDHKNDALSIRCVRD